MSLIDKILKESFLIENKNIGVLYHFTSTNNLVSILESNKLNPSKINLVNTQLEMFNKKEMIYGVSTTRNKNFHKLNTKEIDGFHVSYKIQKSNQIARIELNANKISNKYKIFPYNAYKDRLTNSEYEEVIYTGEKGLINLKNYIIKITLFLITEPTRGTINFYQKKLIPLLK